MKTPISVLIIVIMYWLTIYGVTLVPHISKNYYLNLMWITIIVPNIFRYIIGNVPRLAVDRLFIISTTFIACMITFIMNLLWRDTKDAVKEYGNDRSKTLKLGVLLMTAFASGALITYYGGIDKTLYSNMGWESNNQGLTM